MSKNEVIDGAREIAAAHNMTPSQTDAYVGRCLASYRAGWKDAEKAAEEEASSVFKKDIVWKECAPCDLCGKDAWGVEMQSCMKGREDITTQICANCIRELAKMCKED